MRGITFALLVGALLAGALSGCATARRSEPLAPPFSSNDPLVQRGERVFFQHCHYCHPHGEGGLGPALNNKPLPGFLVKFQARHGLGAMPRFGEDKIPARDLDAVAEYLKALRAQ